jgi:hypothetical protein
MLKQIFRNTQSPAPYRRVGLLLALLTAALNPAHAGPMADVFEKGVFGTKWGDTFLEVAKDYPEGKIIDSGGTRFYQVADNRMVFELERPTDAWITFHFDAVDRLNGVGVHFREEDFAALLRKLDMLFGKHFVPEYQSMPDVDSGVVRMTWPEDDGVKLSLSLLPPLTAPADMSETVFYVSYTALRKPKADKKELGFK